MAVRTAISRPITDAPRASSEDFRDLHDRAFPDVPSEPEVAYVGSKMRAKRRSGRLLIAGQGPGPANKRIAMTARAMTDTGMRTTIRADARPRPSGAKVRSARSAWPTSAVACGHRRWPPSAFRPIRRSPVLLIFIVLASVGGSDTRGRLLALGDRSTRPARRAERMDGSQQLDRDGRALPRHRREADRRRDLRIRLNRNGHIAVGAI